MYQNYKLPGLSKLSRSKVVMDFQKIIVEARSCQSFFECYNLDFYACLTNCVGVFRETGS
jgi:hypothetical protein